MGLFDDIGDAFESMVTDAEHFVGTAIDDGAHMLGDGLNGMGFAGAARAVDNVGDAVADHLGDQVPEQELGQTTDPTQLIHGDLDAMNQTCTRLQDFARAFGETSHGLAGIDTSHWQGTAADAFRAQYHQHPKAWAQAQDACTTAASAWQNYINVVTTVRQQAGQAITLYQQGTQATSQAQAHYAQATATYEQQANTYAINLLNERDPGPMPQPPAAFTDPGAAMRQHAQQILDTARQHRDTAGGQAQQAITAATNTAPTTPSFTQRMGDDLSDAVSTAGVEGEHFAGGLATGTGDLFKFVRGLDPLDPYNVTHPADYVDHLSQTAAGLVHVALHPQDLATGLVGTGWNSDPAQALGHFIPNALSVIGTDGASGAAEGAETAGAARDGAVGAAHDSTASAARSAPDDLVPAPREADPSPPVAPSAHPAPEPTTPRPPPVIDTAPAGWGEFGPQSSSGMEAADSAAASHIEDAGRGLSSIRARLDDLQAHIHPDTTTPSTALADTPAGHPAIPPSTANPESGGASPGDQFPTDLPPGIPATDPAPSPLATDPQVQGDLAQTALQQPDLAALDRLNDGLVWRRDNNLLYHGGNTGAAVFTDGLPVEDIDNLNLPNHVVNHPEFDAYASTTTDPDFWQTWGSGYRYFYDVDAPGGIDVNATLGPHAYAPEQEIAMPGGVRPERIRGMWPLNRDPLTTQVTRGDYVPNPHYRPLQ